MKHLKTHPFIRILAQHWSSSKEKNQTDIYPNTWVTFKDQHPKGKSQQDHRDKSNHGPVKRLDPKYRSNCKMLESLKYN